MGTVPQRDRNASEGDDAATSQSRFERFAHRVSEATGHPTAFAIAFGVILVWAISGPLFGFNETWQLVINTGTTIVTFLMVFLIQCMQNRDTAALQVKLDELLLAVATADNEMIEVEREGERSIEAARRRIREQAMQASVEAPKPAWRQPLPAPAPATWRPPIVSSASASSLPHQSRNPS